MIEHVTIWQAVEQVANVYGIALMIAAFLVPFTIDERGRLPAFVGAMWAIVGVMVALSTAVAAFLYVANIPPPKSPPTVEERLERLEQKP